MEEVELVISINTAPVDLSSAPSPLPLVPERKDPKRLLGRALSVRVVRNHSICSRLCMQIF